MPQYHHQFSSCKGVFQGGGSLGIAYVGAYETAMKQGVTFTEVSGTSVGAIVAAFIAAGATPQEMKDAFAQLDVNRLKHKSWWFSIHYFLLNRIWRKLWPHGNGMKWFISEGFQVIGKGYTYDSSYLEDFIDAQLQMVLRKQTRVTFADLKIPLTVVCADIKAHTYKEFSSHNRGDNDVSVAHAVMCSASVPLYFNVKSNRYVDGCVVSNLPLYTLQQDGDYDKIICFTLRSKGEMSLKPNKPFSIIKNIGSTIIQGGTDLQMRLSPQSYVVEIDATGFDLLDFKLFNDVQRSKQLIQRGNKAMLTFIRGKRRQQKTRPEVADRVLSQVGIRTQVAYISQMPIKRAYVVCPNLKWCWELFPMILKWRNSQTDVDIYLEQGYQYPKLHDNQSEPSRKRMLLHMGCTLHEVTKLPFSGYFFNMEYDKWQCILFDSDKLQGKYYHSRIDRHFITATIQQLSQMPSVISTPSLVQQQEITLQPVDEAVVIRQLASIEAYQGKRISFKDVNVALLRFITRYVMNYKYQNIEHLYKLYRINRLVAFSPAKLLLGGKDSLIAPPVIEEHDGQLYIIEGNTRIFYAITHGFRKLRCIVVDDVDTPMVTTSSFEFKQMILTNKECEGDKRYENFKYQYFRPIEVSVRPYSNYLL